MLQDFHDQMWSFERAPSKKFLLVCENIKTFPDHFTFPGFSLTFQSGGNPGLTHLIQIHIKIFHS